MDSSLSTDARQLRMMQTRDSQLQRRKARFLMTNQDYSKEYQQMLEEKQSKTSTTLTRETESIEPPQVPERKPNGITFIPNTTNIPAKTSPQSSYSLSTAQNGGNGKGPETPEEMHNRLMELGQRVEEAGNHLSHSHSSDLSGASNRVVASNNGGSVELDLSDPHLFAISPVPKGAIVQCYVTRSKGGLKSMFSTTYECFLQIDDTFLIGAKRGTAAAYSFTTERKKFDKSTPSFLGKLRSNFVGTEFTLYDNGLNPSKMDAKDLTASTANLRKELSVVTYEANVLSAKGPRKMTALVPIVRPDTTVSVWRPVKPVDGLLANYRATCTEQMMVMSNKPPRWNDSVGAYVLNFNGRVTMASVKNFQLVRENTDSVILQFGKTGKDQFTMDFTWPLSPYQAFAMCISALDNKLACE